VDVVVDDECDVEVEEDVVEVEDDVEVGEADDELVSVTVTVTNLVDVVWDVDWVGLVVLEELVELVPVLLVTIARGDSRA